MAASTSSFRTLVNREGTLPTPSTDGRWTPTPSRLIHVYGLDEGKRLQFDRVYLNGLHSLRRIAIKNVSNLAPVTVRLGSTLGDQLHFQKRNDNLPDDLPRELQQIATNTVSAAVLADLLPVPNAAFDTAGFIRELVIKPGETTSVVIVFRPDSAHFKPTTLSHLSEHSPGPHGSRADTNSEKALSSVSLADESTRSSIGGINSAARQLYNPFVIDGFVNLDASLSPSPDAQLPPQPAFQQVTLELHATCCQSAFEVTTANEYGGQDVFVDFGNSCLVGEIYVKELDIINLSAVDLHWRIDDPDIIVSSRSSPFGIADTAKGHYIGGDVDSDWMKPGPIAPFASHRLRFILRATEPRNEVEGEITFMNLGDSKNAVQIHLHASVITAPKDDHLRLLTGSSIDFGDCVTGQWHQQVIAFKNVADFPLEVAFTAEKGVEVSFRLEGAPQQDSLDPLALSALDANSLIEANSVAARSPSDSQLPVPVSRTIIHELARSATSQSSSSATVSTSLANFVAGRQTTSPTDPFLDTTSPTDSHYSPVNDQNQLPPKAPHAPGVQRLMDESESVSSRPSGSSGSGDPIHAHQQARSSTTGRSASEEASAHLRTDAQESSGLFRVRDRFKRFEQQNTNRVEDIHAKTNAEIRVAVSYRPARATSLDDDADAARLTKKSFKVFLSYRPWGTRSTPSDAPLERKSITCKSRVCTSFISIKPETLDFEEVELGTSKTSSVTITNLSEIQARVDLRFISKVVSAYRDEIQIEPFKSTDVRLEIAPRRTNPSYQKQISFHNLLNPENSKVCLIKASNVDTRGITYHSHFYSLLTPTGGNFVDFGSVPLNSLALRAITFQNTSLTPVTLSIEAARPQDYELLMRKTDLVGSVIPQSGTEDSLFSGTQEGPDQTKREASTTADERVGRPREKAPAHLKEKVIEAIFQPVRPAPSASTAAATSVERANVDEPVSTKGAGPSGQNHHRTPSSGVQSTSTDASGSTLVAQLRDPKKGKSTAVYGRAVAFRDRSLLSSSEYLDLASGPPVDISRTSPRSKKASLLNSIEQRTVRQARFESPSRSRATRASSRGRTSNQLEPAVQQPSEAQECEEFKKPSAPASQRSSSSKGNSGTVHATNTPSKRRTRQSKDADTGPGSLTRQDSTSSPALTARRRTRAIFSSTDDSGDLKLDEVCAILETHSVHPDSSELSTWQAESAYVKRYTNLRRRLQGAIDSGELQKVNTVTIPVGSDRTVYLLLHPSAENWTGSTSLRKQSSKMAIKLSKEAVAGTLGPGEDIPVRELLLRWSSCKSVMELGMAHINFGTMEKSASKTKKLIIANTSEVPLLYSVRKSGSIASGDIRIEEGRHGIIAGYGRREISVTFEPHFVGQFSETIYVDNVQDETDGEVVRVKAYITRPPTFTVSPSLLEFGPCRVGEVTKKNTITVTNISKSTRTFTIALDADHFTFEHCTIDIRLEAHDGLHVPTLTTEEEEEVESVMQKLKISRRKNQPEKEAKYLNRLGQLGVPLPAREEDAAVTSPADDASTTAASVSNVTASQTSRPTSPVRNDARSPCKSASIVVTLEPQSRRDITIALVPSLLLPSRDCAQASKEDIVASVHVSENADIRSTVQLKACVHLELQAQVDAESTLTHSQTSSVN